MLTFRRTTVCALTVAVVGALAACDSHAPVGGVPAAPTYSADVRAIAACAANVAVPAAITALAPSVSVGPTAVLRVGDAVALKVGTGSRLGFTGVADAGERSVVCRKGAPRSGTQLLVALAPGYVRVGVVGSAARRPRVAFVKVTS